MGGGSSSSDSIFPGPCDCERRGTKGGKEEELEWTAHCLWGKEEQRKGGREAEEEGLSS